MLSKTDGLTFKNQMMRQVVYPTNNEFFDAERERNVRFFTKYDPHLFTRVLEREIDKNDFAMLFRTLFEQKYNDLLEIFENDKAKMNSKDSVALFVKYKDVSVCFIVFNDHKDNFYSLMPLTVFKEYEYKKCDYEITLH